MKSLSKRLNLYLVNKS